MMFRIFPYILVIGAIVWVVGQTYHQTVISGQVEVIIEEESVEEESFEE